MWLAPSLSAAARKPPSLRPTRARSEGLLGVRTGHPRARSCRNTWGQTCSPRTSSRLKCGSGGDELLGSTTRYSGVSECRIWAVTGRSTFAFLAVVFTLKPLDVCAFGCVALVAVGDPIVTAHGRELLGASTVWRNANAQSQTHNRAGRRHALE